MTTPTLPRRLAAIGAAMLLTGSAAPAMAFSDVLAGMQYTFGCAGLMLSDADEHVAQCNPQFPPPNLNSLIDTSSGVAPAVVPPPVVVPPVEEPPVEEPPVEEPPPPEPTCADFGLSGDFPDCDNAV